MMTDPVADMLTRIRNAVRIERPYVDIPYSNLKAGRKYPKTFIETSTKDDRVHPGHARKMAARMKELGYDYVYYENIDGGHSAAANLEQSATRYALEFTYLSQQLID